MFRLTPSHRVVTLLCLLVSSSLSHQSCTEETHVADTATELLPDHPHLYLTSDRLDQVLLNIESEEMAHIYERIQTKSLEPLQTPIPGFWDAKLHGDNAENSVYNAFIAWVEGDEEAAERAIAAMDMLETNWEDHLEWGINIRMQETLMHYAAAWDFLLDTPFFPEEKAASIEEKLTTITEKFYNRYILDDFYRDLAIGVSQNNHPIRTAAAIGFIGIAFPEHPQATEWRDWAVSELDYLFGPDGQYVQEDGGISEGPFYFGFGFPPAVAFFMAVDNTLSPDTTYIRNCINRSDVDPWLNHGCVDGESFTYESPMRSELLHSVLDWSLSLRLPNGNRAPIADSPLRNQTALALFPHYGAPEHHLWDWVSNLDDPYKVRGGLDLAIQHLAYVTQNLEAEPPSWKNRFMPAAGMANFRSGWTEEDRVLVLMGENGSARKTLHDHVDGTSFVLAAYGNLLITDTGYYKPNEFDNAVTANATSHNVILIDGNGAPLKGLLNSWGGADAFIENTVDGDEISYAESRQSYEDTEIIRGVAFVRERYFVMADRLSSDKTESREYRYRLHAFAGYDLDGEVSLESYGPRIQRELGSIDVFTASTAGACTLEEPPYEPLEAPHVHSLDNGAADHTVTDSVITGTAPDFLTILAPYETGTDSGENGPMTATPIETTEGAAWLIETDSYTDVAWIREADAPDTLELSSGEVITTDGHFVLVGLDSTLSLLSRGSVLELDGTALEPIIVGD